MAAYLLGHEVIKVDTGEEDVALDILKVCSATTEPNATIQPCTFSAASTKFMGGPLQLIHMYTSILKQGRLN